MLFHDLRKSPLCRNIAVIMSEARIYKITEERPALQRRSQEKRDRLVKAGFEIFARDGYRDARIGDIAKASGISVGAFYHRFGDKRGFFQVLLTEYTTRGKENWEKFFKHADTNWSLNEFFNRFAAGNARAIDRNMGFFSAYISLGRKDGALAGPILELEQHGTALLLEHLLLRGDNGVENLTLDNVHFAVNSIGKILVMSSVVEGAKYKAQEPHTIKELAMMFQKYLGLDDN